MVADLYLQFRTRTEAALTALLKIAGEMQREPAFLEKVFEIRDIIENLATSTRAGDD